MSGYIWALMGAVLATVLPCIGSACGVQIAGKAAAGVTSEKPELFGKLLIMQALPATQGIYGFLATIMVMMNAGMMGGDVSALTMDRGVGFFMAALPIAFAGLLSAIYQGRTAAASIHMIAKQPDSAAKGITMTAMVETYAILALLISILLITNI
ncbi:MAG: V-type ATP synthase subunit K [Acutalibacteraceae bacterium]